MSDPVNSPDHYTQGGVECIDAIKAALTPEEYRGYLKGNVMKYIWRENHKGGAESLRKAMWYLERLILATAPPSSGEPDDYTGLHPWVMPIDEEHKALCDLLEKNIPNDSHQKK